MNKRVLIGMSGGVDSSAAAILLKQQGYEVIGATMELWHDEENKIEEGCGSLSSTYDAKKVCDALEIPHYVFDFTKEFKECVIDDFVDCYKHAKTPNPCIECNKHLKFNYFYQKALELNCDYIATGHYARTEYSEKYNQYVIKKSNSLKKDQSYVLYNIPKDLIPHVLFPLADYEDKEEIRKIAEASNLKTARKPDSQEICFIPDNDYGNFLLKNLDKKPKQGNIVTTKREILGKHNGLIYYTVGQRKGLGISYKEPLYVIKLDIEKNEVVVGKEAEIFTSELYANNLNYTLFDKIDKPINIKAKIRYSAKEAEAVLYPIKEDLVRVEFKEKQRAITPGQSVVFYVDDDIVLGGGKII